MRGEHRYLTPVWKRATGSSPHARGARGLRAHGHRLGGIIPACAGSTQSWPPSPRKRWDHPRMRGEHGGDGFSFRSIKGSSPHARGALARPDGDFRLAGIIPACAGSTSSRPGPTGRARDHPRMRGEHVVPVVAGYNLMGSSPHARGARHSGIHFDTKQGIIPACAGSTSCPTSAWTSSRDHPRMRGEHSSWESTVNLASGSSPHARGAPDLVDEPGVELGIIPACAGST